jgi:hypothetical protein
MPQTDPMAQTPFYLEAQIKNLLLDARSLADTKRLTDVFEIELFSMEQAVREALKSRAEADGQAALAQGRKLLQALKDAPDKSGGLLIR